MVTPHSSIANPSTKTNLQKIPLKFCSGFTVAACLIITNTIASLAGEVSLSTTNSTIAPFVDTSQKFDIQGNTSCPSPSFNISGFGANADNSASFPDAAGGNSGFTNYGIVAGLNVPFGAGQKFCKDFSALVVAEKKLSNEALLILNCKVFIKAKIDVKSDAFKSSFPSYSKCQDLGILNTSTNDIQDLTPQIIPPEKGPERFRIVP